MNEVCLTDSDGWAECSFDCFSSGIMYWIRRCQKLEGISLRMQIKFYVSPFRQPHVTGLCLQVVAYLDFLKKHASALPARQSMACSLASFLVHRKMLTSSLLSGPVAQLSALMSDSAEIKSHSGTIDLILDTFSEALENGTSSEPYVDETRSELGLVTLASPQYLGTEQVVRRVSVHKIVVDASIKVLSLLAFNYGKGYEEKQGFLRLLNILFPDTQFPLAWIEGRSGEKMPLLTKDQAILFARSNVEKLIRAGEIVSAILILKYM